MQQEQIFWSFMALSQSMVCLSTHSTHIHDAPVHPPSSPHKGRRSTYHPRRNTTVSTENLPRRPCSSTRRGELRPQPTRRAEGLPSGRERERRTEKRSKWN